LSYAPTVGKLLEGRNKNYSIRSPWQLPYVAFANNTLTGGLALDLLGRFLDAMEGDAKELEAETLAENGS
jgi:hypothetical protein